MREVTSVPAVVNGKFVQWSEDPVEDVLKMLDALTFAPKEMSVSVESDIWAAAKVLKLPVASNCEDGALELPTGVRLAYKWASAHGRSVDWIQLSGAYHREALLDLVKQLASAMSVKYRHDLQVVVSSEPKAPILSKLKEA